MRINLAMQTTHAITTSRNDLGEGAVWDARAGRLLWVDIARGRVAAWRTGDAAERVVATAPPEVGAVVPRRNGGLVLAVERELVALDPDGTRRTLAAVEADRSDNRFNDCRCDPQGRLWAGTMSRSRDPGAAALYRIVAGEPPACVLQGLTLSNGMGWSPAGDRMYHVDSVTARVDVLDFDAAAGTLQDRRRFAEIRREDGMPDGLTVDAEGGVWVCLFGGGAVRRYDADGRLDAVVQLPVTNPTCPAFGGADLRTLFVTSARRRLSAAQLAAEPLAGAVLALEPGVGGMASAPFAG